MKVSLFPLILSTWILFCAQPITNDNVYDPACGKCGNYAFSSSLSSNSINIEFSSGKGDKSSDTVSAGESYNLTIEDSGEDKYIYFLVSALQPSILTKSSTKKMDDSLRSVHNGVYTYTGNVVFSKTGQCDLIIEAVRKNRTIDSLHIVLWVENPFEIRVDSASYLQGKGIYFYVYNKVDSVFFHDEPLIVIWTSKSRKNSGSDTLSYDSVYTHMLDSLPDTIIIGAVVKNDYGVSVSVRSIKVPVISKYLPEIHIHKDSIEVSIHNQADILVDEVRNTDSIIWFSKLKNDTIATTFGESIGLLKDVWTEPDTLVLTAKNRFNTIGNSDEVRIIPLPYFYSLDVDTFPREINVGELTQWRVYVKKDNARLDDPDIKYNWDVEPKEYKSFDTNDANGGVCKLFYDDLVEEPFTISVYAFNSKDTFLVSPVQSVMVWVVGHDPRIDSVIIKKDTISINEPAYFTVHAEDVNSDGSVVAYFFQLDGLDSSFQMKGNSDTVSFIIPGEHTVCFWCIDNSGFSSDTVSRKIFVSTNTPYFNIHIDSIVGYVEERFTIAAPAHPGKNDEGEDNKDSLIEWRWFSDSACEHQILTTSVDNFDTVFYEPEIIPMWVRCYNTNGDSSGNGKRIIRISQGLPCVAGAEIASDKLVYVNDSIGVHVSAYDSNASTIAQIRFFIDEDSVLTVLPAAVTDSVDTVIYVPVPSDSGHFSLSVVAVDNDINVSAPLMADKPLEVLLGKPRVTRITPDTCWISEEVTYTITASDINSEEGLRYFIRFDTTDEFYDIAHEDYMKHTFLQAGIHYIGSFVIDEDEVVSDTFTSSVIVEQGMPHIESIDMPDSVFVNDYYYVTLALSDPNDIDLTLMISWDGDTIYEYSQTVNTGDLTIPVVQFKKETIGIHSVPFILSDKDTSFDTTVMINVMPGAPIIDTIGCTTEEESLFVADSISFFINAHDGNGDLERIYLNWDGDTIAQDTIIINSMPLVSETEIVHRYSIQESGNRTIVAWAVDDDSIASERFRKVVEIRRGDPVITEIKYDAFWINDTNTISISTYDTNGTIIMKCADWNRDGVWDDTAYGDDSLAHAWRVTDFNAEDINTCNDTFFSFAIKVMDDDSFEVVDTGNVYVNVGAPSVWTDSDTLYCPTNNSSNIVFTVNASDANEDDGGIITRYRFDRMANGTIEKDTNAAACSYDMFQFDTAFLWSVEVVDDDSLTASDTFFVYLDNYPKIPELFFPEDKKTYYQSDYPTITFKWKNFDVRDGLTTQYQIMWKNGGDFRPLFEKEFETIYDEHIAFDTSDSTFSYDYFSEDLFGTVEWYVIAKDRSNSLSTSDTIYFRYDESEGNQKE